MLLALPATLHAQGKRPMTDADVMRLRAVDGVAISPGGDRVLYTVAAWEHIDARSDTALGDKHERRTHVWIVPFAGGEARQLTSSERGETHPQWSPDGSMIAFVSARGSGTGEDAPKPQLWVLRVDGGEASVLTSARDGVVAFRWSPDGRRIAYTTPDTLSREAEAKVRRKDDPKVYEGDLRRNHLWVIDVATRHATKVTSGDFTVRGASWSRDGTTVAFDASPTTLIRDERRDAYVVDVASRRVDRLTTSMDVQSTPQFSPDGRTLAFTIVPHDWKMNRDSIMTHTVRNAHLVTWDVASRTLADHTSPSFDYSPDAVQWSGNGTRLVFTATDRVWPSVYEYTVASRTYAQVTHGIVAGEPSLSRDGSRMAFRGDMPSWPAEVYVREGTSAPRRITTSNPWLADVALGESKVITWKSTDGATVEGVLLEPAGYTPGRRVPLLVSAHGGPTWAYTNGFKGDDYPGQTWAGRGWAVLYPNPRGSTGYGEKWMRGNIPDWGGGDYRDIMSGVDDVIRRGVADSTRMAFEGWSYGGYMTSWVVSQTTRFKAAMMGAGLPSLLSMSGTTDIPGYLN
ncbi:MAG: hypothetical protein JWN53_1363, partial [Gemmatimonadetes bacterium]|nr:hypothetical protein [Gemmatimonadota bacterium]